MRTGAFNFASIVAGHLAFQRANSKLHSCIVAALVRSKGIAEGVLRHVLDRGPEPGVDGAGQWRGRTVERPHMTGDSINRLSADLWECDHVLPFTLTGLINIVLQLHIVAALLIKSGATVWQSITGDSTQSIAILLLFSILGVLIWIGLLCVIQAGCRQLLLWLLFSVQSGFKINFQIIACPPRTIKASRFLLNLSPPPYTKG